MNAANLQLSAEEMRLVSDPAVILTKNSIIQKVVGLFAALCGEYQEVYGGQDASSQGDSSAEANLQALSAAAPSAAPEAGSSAEPRAAPSAAPAAGSPAEPRAAPSAAPAAGFPAPAEAGSPAEPRAVPSPSPKISKGENYQGLPYVMLDYPRLFGREDVLAIRTFFWWGHGFSVTLHLKGSYLRRYLPVWQQRWAELAAAGFHVGVSQDEWRHEHVEDNYRPIVSAEDLTGENLAGDVSAPESPGATGSSFLKLSAACGLDQWQEAPAVLLGSFRVLVSVLWPMHRDVTGDIGGSGR